MDFAITPEPDARIIRQELLATSASASLHDYACLALGGLALAALLAAGTWAAAAFA